MDIFANIPSVYVHFYLDADFDSRKCECNAIKEIASSVHYAIKVNFRNETAPMQYFKFSDNL